MSTIKEILENNFGKKNEDLGLKFRIIFENYEHIEKAINNKNSIKDVYNALDKHGLLHGIKFSTFKQYYLKIKKDKKSEKPVSEQVQNQVSNETIDKIFFKYLVRASDEKKAQIFVKYYSTLSKDQRNDLANTLNSIDPNHKKGELYNKLLAASK